MRADSLTPAPNSDRPPRRSRPRLARCASRLALAPLLALLLLPPLLLLAPALAPGRNFGFRDAAHYYRPQYAWEERERRAGRTPLWNPQDHLGVSVAADPTAALYYPGKLLLRLPMPFERRFKLYVAAHLLVAAVAAYTTCRAWGVGRAGATLGALSYACGGNVLSLTANPVYLVGAAWLPWALLALDAVVRRASWRATAGLAAVLAAIVLGGDPQLAVNLLLVGALRFGGELWARRARRRTTLSLSSAPSPAPARSHPSPVRIAWTLGAATVAAGLLAAVQLAPAWVESRTGARAAFDRPRSAVEVVEWLQRDEPRSWHDLWLGVAGPAPAGSHDRRLYDFSVGPWRLIEFGWPNVFGRLGPEFRRWGFAIPAEGRVWTPTLYQGLLPLLTAIVAARLARDRRSRWLLAAAVLSLVATWGRYGGGWLIRELAGALGSEPPGTLDDPVGGLYWWLVKLVPGYVQFRYPAKWGVVASAALALLAAQGFDRWLRTSTAAARTPGSRGAGDRTLVRLLGVVIGVSLVASIGLVGARSSGLWQTRLGDVPPDAWLGPFDADAAWRDAFQACLASSFVAAVALAIVRRGGAARSSGGSSSLGAAWPLVALTAAELLVAQQGVVIGAPESAWRAGDPVAASVGANRFIRRPLDGGLPAAWRLHGSPDRFVETVGWEAAALFSKLHLAHEARSVDSPVAVESLDYELLRDELRRSAPGPRFDALCELLDVACVIEPPIDTFEANDTSDTSDTSDAGDAGDTGERRTSHGAAASAAPPAAGWNVRPLGRPPGRFRLVRDVVVLPPVDERRLETLRRRTTEVLLERGSPRDWNRTAVVETADDFRATVARSFANLDAASSSTGERPEKDVLHVVEDSPERLRIAVDLPSPALLVVADRDHPDWRSEVRPRDAGAVDFVPTPTLRTNRICRGVWLPAGRWEVQWRHRCDAWRWGATASAASWTALALAVVVAGIRNEAGRRRTRPTRPART